jgi:hypothetical protein
MLFFSIKNLHINYKTGNKLLCFMTYRYVLCVERAMSNPGTPAPTPSPAVSFSNHTLHPDAILAGLCYLGGDEGSSPPYTDYNCVTGGNQCCGSITVWYGSGSAVPYQWIRILWRSRCQQQISFLKLICFLLFERTFYISLLR